MTSRVLSHRLLATAFLVGLGAVAAWSSLSGLAPGDVTLVPCPFHAVTGVPCPGCGMTRACVAVARGDLAAAWGFHPFALLVVPLAVVIAVFPAGSRAAFARTPRAVRRVATSTALAACLGLWLCRLL